MNELEPGASDSNETRPEDLDEPKTNEAESVENNEIGDFVESEEMQVISTSVEQGEPLTVELYTAYQLAGEAIINSLSGDEQGLRNLEMQLKCYELQAIGGMGSDAIEAINNLIAEMPDTDFYANFYAKAMSAAERIAQNLK